MLQNLTPQIVASCTNCRRRQVVQGAATTNLSPAIEAHYTILFKAMGDINLGLNYHS